MGFNWKCGLTKEVWSLVIAVIDIVKGTLGLIFSIYLCATIIPWIFQVPDYVELKHEMINSSYIYILANGGTRGGVVMSLLGATVWHLCLIIFGIFLIWGVRRMLTPQLRAWYLYTLLSNIAFCGFYIRLGLTLSETWDETGVVNHSGGIAILFFYYILICFIPTIYSLAIVHSVVIEIYTIQRDHVPVHLRRKSIMPPSQDSKL